MITPMSRRRIYALYDARCRQVKIGCSVAPANRCMALSYRRRASLVVLASVPGGFRKERDFHLRLRGYAVDGDREWFKESPEVWQLIHEMRLAASHIEAHQMNRAHAFIEEIESKIAAVA